MSDLLQRLAAANPVSEGRQPPIEDVWRKVAAPPQPARGAWRRAGRRVSQRHSRPWTARRWSVTAATAAFAVALALIGLLSGSVPNRAQAFPVLGEHATLTPASLQQALKIYGVAPDNAGLNIREGRPFATPWGTGYVLTNNDRSFVCAVAPGSGPQTWGASCARTEIAKREGTATFEYSYDKATNTARFLTLLPAGATATAQPQGQQRLPIPLHSGVLALVVHRRTVITTHIGDRVRVTEVTPSNAHVSPGPVDTAPGSHTTTVAAPSPAASSRYSPPVSPVSLAYAAAGPREPSRHG
jgi:hypothetical protein